MLLLLRLDVDLYILGGIWLCKTKYFVLNVFSFSEMPSQVIDVSNCCNVDVKTTVFSVFTITYGHLKEKEPEPFLEGINHRFCQHTPQGQWWRVVCAHAAQGSPNIGIPVTK